VTTIGLIGDFNPEVTAHAFCLRSSRKHIAPKGCHLGGNVTVAPLVIPSIDHIWLIVAVSGGASKSVMGMFWAPKVTTS